MEIQLKLLGGMRQFHILLLWRRPLQWCPSPENPANHDSHRLHVLQPPTDKLTCLPLAGPSPVTICRRNHLSPKPATLKKGGRHCVLQPVESRPAIHAFWEVHCEHLRRIQRLNGRLIKRQRPHRQSGRQGSALSFSSTSPCRGDHRQLLYLHFSSQPHTDSHSPWKP